MNEKVYDKNSIKKIKGLIIGIIVIILLIGGFLVFFEKIENGYVGVRYSMNGGVKDQADIVVNILPATKETAQLFNADLFAEMKDDSIFVNVGRGETVDIEALIEALDSGKLSAAGLDVFKEEPLPKGHPVWSNEKIAMTPHIAGRVENYDASLYAIFQENLKAFVENEDLPRNVVVYETGY